MDDFIKKSLFLITIGFICLESGNARVHRHETTRLKSTAGTGVASVLLDESAVLNPATIAFFNSGSLYIQKVNTSYQLEDGVVGGDYSETDDLKTLIVADAKSKFKGSASYQKTYEGGDSRRRMSASMGRNLGKDSAFGILYENSKERNLNQDGNAENTKYNQISIGAMHSFNTDFTAGLVLYDVLRKVDEDHRFTFGLQYIYKGILALMLDAGSDYRENLSENFFWSTAIQFKFFKDFFLRVGTFQNKYLKEKGNGIGVNWVTPKLSFDIAFKSTLPTGVSQSTISYGTEVRETSFSLSYLF